MTSKTVTRLIIFLLLFASSSTFGQLYVSSGVNIYLQAGITFAVDSLILQPTSTFTIGSTTETRSASLTHSNPNPTILRTYNFSPSISPFSGTIGIYYRTSELNSLPQNSLTLNVHNGSSWTVYNSGVTRNAVNNYVTTSGLSNLTLSELTLSGTAGITFSGKVFLQAAYNTSNSNMDNTLNSSGILQANALSQPYNPIYSYTGAESVASGFFASHTDIVDWVLVELRDPSTPSTVVATRAVFLKQDGTLVDTNGTSNQISFQNTIAGNYYVSIRHRNHMGIRSANTIDFSGGSGSYDFSTSAGQSFQNQSYTSTIQTGNIWSMRAGNANSNNNVKYNGPGNDQNQILNIKLGGSLSNILNNVYSTEDINMNGNVKWNGPGNDQNYLLNVLLGGSLSIVYLEQLY